MASRHGKEGTDEVKSLRGADEADSGDYHSRSSPSDEPRSGKKDNRDRRRSRSRSPVRRRRSTSRDRRRSRSRDRDRRRNDGAKYSSSSSRRYSSEKPRDDDRRHKHSQAHHGRHRSRSSSTERLEKERERSKLEMRQQMARNYEEQIERLKTCNQLGIPPVNRYPNQPHVEPAKLVEQIEKRKFLFKKDKPTGEAAPSTSTSTLWKNTAFVDDSDGKMTAKFKRLMGMKESADVQSSSSNDVDEDSLKKQSEYFANLEKQYEVARATTHTQRGVGLGFSSRGTFPVHPKP